MTDLHFPKFIDPALKDPYVRDSYIFDIYDGDTIYYHADLGYDVWATFLTGRLLDVNAPEIRPLVSRDEGLKSKAELVNMIATYALNRDQVNRPFGWKLRIQSVATENKWVPDQRVMKKGKFGRWLVSLYGVDNNGVAVNLNELMLREGFAVPYVE